jgi:hypothetical protein
VAAVFADRVVTPQGEQQQQQQHGSWYMRCM